MSRGSQLSRHLTSPSPSLTLQYNRLDGGCDLVGSPWSFVGPRPLVARPPRSGTASRTAPTRPSQWEPSSPTSPSEVYHSLLVHLRARIGRCRAGGRTARGRPAGYRGCAVYAQEYTGRFSKAEKFGFILVWPQGAKVHPSIVQLPGVGEIAAWNAGECCRGKLGASPTPLPLVPDESVDDVAFLRAWWRRWWPSPSTPPACTSPATPTGVGWHSACWVAQASDLVGRVLGPIPARRAELRVHPAAHDAHRGRRGCLVPLQRWILLYDATDT